MTAPAKPPVEAFATPADTGGAPGATSVVPVGTPVTVAGTRLTLLTEGPDRLRLLLELIDGARTSLRMLYYIYADDAAGRAVNDALLRAAARGVRVSLIVDGFGSGRAAIRNFFDPLTAGGCSVCRFQARLGFRALLRNHQKLALADAEAGAGARALIGGFNIEDDYFAAWGSDGWRDLGLLVEGETAARVGGYFDALDAWVRDPDAKIRHLSQALSGWSEESGPLRWLIGGPTRKLSPWARAIRRDLREGHESTMIAGYFTPSPIMLSRLRKARREGVALRVVTAGRSDNNITIAAARFTYRGLLKRGAQVYEYRPSKLHTKLYVIDDVVHIGSANMDMRSILINLEMMLRIEDPVFAAQVRAYSDGEVAHAEEWTLEDYRAKTGWWQRTKQLFAYLILAVLDPSVSRGLNWGIDR